MNYKKAILDDLDILVKTRIEVLRVANHFGEGKDMSFVEKEIREYYVEALKNNTHTAYLIFDGDNFVGTGGVSYYKVMPTCCNPSGHKAYIMNIYTRPEYRRRGIAYKTLDLLVEDAKARGITFISLEATDMGKPMYKKYGFAKMNDEMQLLL